MVDVRDALDVVVTHDQAPELVVGHRPNPDRVALMAHLERLPLRALLARFLQERWIDLGGAWESALVLPGQQQECDQGESDVPQGPSTPIQGSRQGSQRLD